jgi:hypothetical protein
MGSCSRQSAVFVRRHWSYQLSAISQEAADTIQTLESPVSVLLLTPYSSVRQIHRGSTGEKRWPKATGLPHELETAGTKQKLELYCGRV